MDYICRIPGKNLEAVFEKTGDCKFLGQKISSYYIHHFYSFKVNHSTLRTTKMCPYIQLQQSRSDRARNNLLKLWWFGPVS